VSDSTRMLAGHRCQFDGHLWQRSVSIQEIEAQIGKVDDRIPVARLRKIAIDVGIDVSRWLAAKPDRRICGSCGIQGRAIPSRVIPMLPSSEAITETAETK
jgi:hypothetical protein